MITACVAMMFGLAFGSFANAAIDRLTSGRSLFGRSYCDACGVQLRAADLVPVISYIALRGRCRACLAPIGARTPMVEGACAIAFAAAFVSAPAPLATLLAAMAVVGIVLTGVVISRARGVA
jgi:prepilin signal peptidase PulO-like enzyme (type II secretory pathway)